MIIRAELTGDDTCTALGVTVKTGAPVLALCRALIAAGHNPQATLEAYRRIGGRDMLCLRVRSLAEGAALTAEFTRTGAPTFKRYRPPQRGE